MVFVKDYLRLATGKKNGRYKNILPEIFTSKLLDTLLSRNEGVKVNEVILANSIGTGGNMARNIVLRSKLPKNTPAITIDAQCCGGIESLNLAYNALKNEDQQSSIIAGGMESNSLAPFRYFNDMDPRKKNQDPYFFAPFSPDESDLPLAQAESLALEKGISIEAMINWTLDSHKKAIRGSSHLKERILFLDENELDETIKSSFNQDTLFKLSKKSLIGAHNTAHYHDGAALILLSNIKEDTEFQIIGFFKIGIEPDRSPHGPIEATEGILKKYDLKIKDIDLFEIGESFAVKPLLFFDHFKIDPQIINIFGGNLAYGHPFGASGTIACIHLMEALKVNKKKRGIVAFGAVGGYACAILIERIIE